MKKSMLSGVLMLTIGIGGIVQASPTTATAPKPALPVVAGAKALSQSEKADVNGGLLDVVVQINGYRGSRIRVVINNYFSPFIFP